MIFNRLFIFFFSTTLLIASSHYNDAIKEKKLYPMGEKIYKKKCKNFTTSNFSSLEELHNVLTQKQPCGMLLNHKYLDALALYIWDIKEGHKKQKKYPKLIVTKGDKCPVCGMFLHKYPQWIATIVYNNKKLSFDGIKDMMKYYFEHKNGIKEIFVQDYYTKETLDAKKAYFVVGSDVYGPMGNELISLKSLKSAKRFRLDHKADEILKFNEITQKRVYQLDE
ncbi:nitrous oxide reductase accessory protein NosL [Sulfurimonas sp.]